MAIHGHFVHQLFKFVLSSHTLYCACSTVFQTCYKAYVGTTKWHVIHLLIRCLFLRILPWKIWLGLVCAVTWDFSILNQELLGPYSHVAAHTCHIFVPWNHVFWAMRPMLQWNISLRRPMKRSGPPHRHQNEQIQYDTIRVSLGMFDRIFRRKRINESISIYIFTMSTYL